MRKGQVADLGEQGQSPRNLDRVDAFCFPNVLVGLIATWSIEYNGNEV